MKHINTNPRYSEAAATLAQLVQAEVQATAEESRLLALLAAPTQREPVLLAAARLLRGEAAAPADTTGLNQQLSHARAKLEVLRPAIEQQRQVLTALASELSAAVNSAAEAEHLDAVQGLADALEATRAALARMEAQRDEIEAAGYRCTLPVLSDPQIAFVEGTATSRVLAECVAHAALYALRQGPAVSLHLLVECQRGLPGDVVPKVPAAEAARLVGMGQAEVTDRKPYRVQRLKSWETAEVVLS